MVAELVEALRYKPEGRGFGSRILPAALTALGSAQPVTEMSTTNISWGGREGGLKRPVHRADTLTTFMCRLY